MVRMLIGTMILWTMLQGSAAAQDDESSEAETADSEITQEADPDPIPEETDNGDEPVTDEPVTDEPVETQENSDFSDDTPQDASSPVVSEGEVTGTIGIADDDPIEQAEEPAEESADDQIQQPTPAEQTSKAVQPAKAEAQKAAEDDQDLTSAGVPRQYVYKPEGQVFGRKRVRLMVGKPKFDDGQQYYDTLYGAPKNLPEIQADYFFWDWYVTVGVSLGVGFYQADGAAGKRENGEIVKDNLGQTTQTWIPIQYALIGQMTPLPWKWVVIDYWVGAETTYWQEVRYSVSSEEAAFFLAAADSDAELTNKGAFKKAGIVGMSVNLKINGLDSRGVNSMRGPMGIGNVYVTGYMETVRSTSPGVSFGRTVMGLGFTFESVN